MNTVDLQLCYAYRQLPRNVLEAMGGQKSVNTQSAILLALQLIPFMRLERQKAFNSKSVAQITANPFDNMLDYVTDYNARVALNMIDQDIQEILYILNNIHTIQPDDSNDLYKAFLGLMTIQPIKELCLDPRVLYLISDVIVKRLESININQHIFIKSCFGNNRSNHLIDVLLCRNQLFNAIQHHRIDCIILNESIFRAEQQKLQDFEDQQKSQQKFSTYIACRRCHMYMIQTESVQVSLSLDEINRFKCICHNPSCRLVFMSCG